MYTSDRMINLSANLVMQGEYRFYIASMPSETLGQTCFVVTREEDPDEGFQRRLDENRAQEIAKYIDEGKGSIPTAIILSAQQDANLRYNSKNKTISFRNHRYAFLIIDGQHRVFGFKKAKQSIRVPVIIYEGLTRQEEAKLFIDINTTQKQVSQALLLDVKRLLQNESDEEKQCSELFELFYRNNDSTLRNKLARAETTNGKISRRLFNQSVAPLLSNLKDLSTEQSYKVLNAYLAATQKIFTEIDEQASNALTRPVIFQSVLINFPKVMDKALTKHNKVSLEAFYDTLRILKTNLSRSHLLRPGNSYRKFTDILATALNQVYLKPNMIAEE